MEEKLITALVAFLLAGAAWLKSHSEVEGVKKRPRSYKRQIYLYALNLTQVSESVIYSKIKNIFSEQTKLLRIT